MQQLPERNLDWPIAWDAVVEIAKSEGCRLKAYRCPAGEPTIGWGHTKNVQMGDEISQQLADKWFVDDLQEFAAGVKRNLSRQASPNELGALVSLAYNIGLAGFARSTVLKQHNAGNFRAAARAFALWNKVKGQEHTGLTARRAREAALYLAGNDEDLPLMPQKVEDESNLTVSPIAVSGAVTATAGLLAGLTGLTEQGEAIAAALGVDPLVGFAIVAAWTGFTALRNRAKQRNEGWA